ncbi:hypothetical protein M758_8G038600 [Ceratodon purpureus]|nr:hypothetical protein M758_8G038600 [Ceratodon purpureus]
MASMRTAVEIDDVNRTYSIININFKFTVQLEKRVLSEEGLSCPSCEEYSSNYMVKPCCLHAIL